MHAYNIQMNTDVDTDLVSCQHEEASEGGEVRNHAQVLWDGPETPGAAGPAKRRQLVEQAVHVHQVALRLHLPDPRPLRLPQVVVGVTAFRQAVRLPAVVVRRVKNKILKQWWINASVQEKQIKTH